jgi:phosphonate transport system substrate-binding protein
MPEFFIRENTGKSPGELFEHPFGFSGSHSKTAELVAQGGSVKAGVLNYLTYERMIEAGRIDGNVCRVVWRTPPYADYNFTAHPALEQMFGAGFTDRLQATLVSMDDADLLAAFERSSLIPATNEQFEKIAVVARSLGMLR